MARRELAVNITGDATSLQRALERSEKKVADLETRLRSSSKGFDQHARSAERSEKSLDKLNVALGNSTHQTKVFSGMVENIKFPALVTGAGLAAQALSSMAAGGVALASSLAPLSGAIAAYPALGAAAAQGMGVFQLATRGLDKAIQAAQKGGKDWEKFLKEGTKEQIAFARAMRPSIKAFDDLQAVAQRNALPGFVDGIKSASRNLDVIKPIVRDTADAFGDLAVKVGRIVGGREFGADLALQGDRNVRWMVRGGDAALDLGQALEDVTIAAGPLVNWMTLMGARAASLVKNFADTNRENGKLARFFHETQVAMSRVVRIGGDLATAFFNIGKAGKPLGDEILVNLVKAADQFRKWTDSARGQNTIREYFRQARPAIFELGRLINDAGAAFFRLGRGDQVAPLLRQVRTQLLPVFERLVDSTTRSFGPELINTLTQVLGLFGRLAGSNGPLVQMVILIGRVAERINWIIDHVPGVGNALVTIAGLGGLAKALQLSAAITGVGRLIGLLKTARTTAATVGAVEAGGAAAGAAAGRGRGGAAAAALATPAGIVGTAATLGAFQVLQGVIDTNRKKAEQFADGLRKAQAAARGFASEGNVRAIRVLSSSIEDFGRKTGASTQDIRKAQRAMNDIANNALTNYRRRWGQTLDQVNTDVRGHFAFMRRTSRASMQDISQAVTVNTKIIRQRLGDDTAEGRQALANNFRQAARQVKLSMNAGVVSTREGTSEIRDLMIRGLQALGLTRDQARAKITNGTLQLSSQRVPGAGAGRRAGGGWVGQRGERGGDNIPIVVGAGEAVLNRHQQAVVEGLLGDGFLDRLFATVQTPHYLARGGRAGRKFARGGGIVPVPGFPGESAASSVITMIEFIAKRFGLTLTDAYGPGKHQSPGHTVTGTAADFAGADKAMDAAVRYLVGRGYLVGYDGRFGSQRWGGHGPSYVAGSNAHLHVELAGRGGAPLLAAPKIRVGRVGGAGAVQAMVQRGLGVAGSAANAVMQRVADSMLMTPVAGGGGLTSAGGQYNKRALMALWQRAGGPANVANIAGAIALAESGGNPNARNSIGATGLWQIYNGPNTSLGLKDPMANAQAAVAKWRAAGGFTPWTTYTGADTPGHERTYLRYLASGGFVARAASAARGKPPVVRARRIGNRDANQPVTITGRKPPSVTATQLQRGLGYLDVQLARAEGTKSLEDDRRVMRRQRTLQQQRLQWVQFNLRNAVLSPATRADLRTEQAQLIRDIRDLDTTIRDPFLGHGAPDVPERVSPLTGAQTFLDSIDLQERAGVIDQATAAGMRTQVRQGALAGKFGALNQDETWQVMADLRDATQAATDAQQEQTQALQEHTAALKSVQDELVQQRQLAQSATAASNTQAWRALADIMSGQIGFMGAARAATAGAGTVARY